MIVKTHLTANGKLLAVCDEDILGRRFEEGDRQLDLSGSFYKGTEVSDDVLGRMLNDVYVVNAVGEKSVGFLIARGLVNPGCVVCVAGVPCAQAILKN